MEYMHLVGTEDVRAAASRMQQAADTIKQSVETLDYALQRHQQFLSEWLDNYTAAIRGAVECSDDRRQN